MTDDLAVKLRAADEDTVIEAGEGMCCTISATPAELLELFNRMLDLMGVPDTDGDVFERVH
jgi:hypothetical protein